MSFNLTLDASTIFLCMCFFLNKPTSSISITLPPHPPQKKHIDSRRFLKQKKRIRQHLPRSPTFLMRFMDPVLNSEGFCPGIPKPNLVWPNDKRRGWGKRKGRFLLPCFLSFSVNKTYQINQLAWRSYRKKPRQKQTVWAWLLGKILFPLTYQMMWTSIFFWG